MQVSVTFSEPKTSYFHASPPDAPYLRKGCDEAFLMSYTVSTNVDVTSLEYLYLDSNEISSFPPDFKYLGNLILLSIRANAFAITGFKPDYLDLGNNRLCPADAPPGDSSWISLSPWLDSFDRDWQETQNCKKTASPI
jgi:hypothetical protein